MMADWKDLLKVVLKVYHMVGVLVDSKVDGMVVELVGLKDL